MGEENKKDEKVVEEVKAIEETLTKSLTKMQEELSAHGETSEKTGKNITKLTDDLSNAINELQEAKQKYDEAGEASQKRMDELETKMNRVGDPGIIPDEMKSPGELFVDSDQVKHMITTNDVKCGPVRMKTLFPGILFAGERKTNLLSTPPSRLVVPMRDAMVPATLRDLRMRDLIPVRPTQSNSIEYIREAGFNAGATTAITSIAILSNVATVTSAAVHGYVTGERIRISGATSSTEINTDHWIIVTSTTVYTFVTSAADDAAVTGTLLQLQLMINGAASEVAEAGTKPEAQLDLELLTESVQTIAHWIPASRQILADASQLESYVNDRLRYGVLYREDLQTLYGTGASPQIQGILTEAGILQYAWSSGLLSPLDTKIDAIRRGMTLAHRREHFPTGVVLNPTDWEDIQLSKGTDEHYIWLSVGIGTEQRFFQVPVVVTNAIAAGTALTGAFATATTLWDREDVNVRVSESHSTFFVENMVALLAEERVCQTIHRPDSFVAIDFDAAPS